MSDALVLGASVLLLSIGSLLHIPLILLLLIGAGLFIFYGYTQRISIATMLRASIASARTMLPLVGLFCLVGALSALWRASGTIAWIIATCAPVLSGQALVALAFVFCTLMSMLLGTAFGTAATMGAVCMAVGDSLGVPSILMGGAVMAGCFVGDRMSPLSTTAVLVARLTNTSLPQNLKAMFLAAALPFTLSLVLYISAGLVWANTPVSANALPFIEPLAAHFTLHHPVLLALPALAVIGCCILRRSLLHTLAISTTLAAILAVFLQQLPLTELVETMLFGYHVSDASIAPLVSGGGILALAPLMGVVLVGGAYPGLFATTGLLKRAHTLITTVDARFGSFAAVCTTSLFTSAIACNQTLAIVLTQDLCKQISDADTKRMALYLENSAELLAALMPWSISCLGVLEAAGAPTASILAAVFIYLVPLTCLAAQQLDRCGHTSHRPERALLLLSQGQIPTWKKAA